MIIPGSTSTVVLLGNWNAYILTPEWVGKHIFEEEKIPAEFFLGPALVFRFRARGCRIVTSQDRVTIVADQTTQQSLEEIEKFATKLHRKLPYTPITALGVNHAFLERAAGEELLNLFKFPDESKLPAHLPVEHFEISRRLAGEGHSINVKISKEQGLEDVRFDFNFHYQKDRDFKEGDSEILKEGAVLEHFEFAKNLLESEYDLELEEEQEGLDGTED